MAGVHGAAAASIKLGAAPTGAEHARVPVGQHLVVHVGSAAATLVDPDLGSVTISAEVIGRRQGPFGVQRGFSIGVAAIARTHDTSRRPPINGDFLDVVGQIWVLAMEARDVAEIDVTVSGQRN
jgi:hypothetical protein